MARESDPRRNDVMRKRIVFLLVLAMLVIGALAIPASAQPGCQQFGKDLVAATAHRDTGVGAIASGQAPGTMPDLVNFFKDANCGL